MLRSRTDQLAEVLAQYGEPYQLRSPVNDAALRSGFSGAAVWKIETGAGPMALRAMEGDRVQRDRLTELHRLLEHLGGNGFHQTPVPVRHRHGATWLERDGVIWQLEPWMPGRADYAAHPSEQRLIAALQCLARWHIAAKTFVSSDAGRPWFSQVSAAPSPGLNARCARIRKWDLSLLRTVRKQLPYNSWPEFAQWGERILELYQRQAADVLRLVTPCVSLQLPQQPCLRDIWHDHLLYEGDVVTGLIDPHAARSDCVATDLARLLGSLVGDDRHLWQVGLHAYRQIRPLSVDELAMVELFDRTTVLLSGLTWLEWQCLEGKVFPDPAAVLERLRSIVQRLEYLGKLAAGPGDFVVN
jgi:Ser/Thr protein kinase RdoA (MazF antagonist)